jgi:hypothetical protein
MNPFEEDYRDSSHADCAKVFTDLCQFDKNSVAQGIVAKLKRDQETAIEEIVTTPVTDLQSFFNQQRQISALSYTREILGLVDTLRSDLTAQLDKTRHE